VVRRALGEVHAVVDRVRITAAVLVMMRGPPRPAHDEEEVTGGIQHDRRRHGAQHALAGCDRVLRPFDESELIGDAGVGREIIHLVVEKKARART